MSSQMMSRRDLVVLAATSALAARTDMAGASPRASHDGIPGPLARFIRAYMTEMDAPGLALGLANGRGAIGTAVYGVTDLRGGTPVSPEHLFEIGSITKSFVGLMILQLQDEGRLDVQHSILRYLPWLPIDTDYGDIRIHHLLTHSSGMPGSAAVHLGEAGARSRQAFRPGTQFDYCNWGYDVLGRLIEHLDGCSWAEAVARRIFAPLGMSASVGAISNQSRARIAPSYVPLHDDRPFVKHGPLTLAGNLAFTLASGCIASTPRDMTRYLQMLINRGAGPTSRIVSAEGFMLFSALHIEAAEFGAGAHYGYGIAIDQLDGHTRLRHTGGMVSFMSSLQVDLDAGIGAFSSINAQLGYRPNPVSEFALRLLRAEAEGQPIPPSPATDPLVLIDNASDYAGVYAATDGRTLEVIAEGQHLQLRADGVSCLLRRAEGDVFVADHPGFRLFALAFGREPGDGRATDTHPRPVVDVASGTDWYGRGHSATEPPPLAAPELAPYAGLYYTENPWVGTVRIVLRRGRLWVDGTQSLVSLGAGLFRVGDDPSGTETVEFRAIAEGRAYVLLISGSVLQRIAPADAG